MVRERERWMEFAPKERADLMRQEREIARAEGMPPLPDHLRQRGSITDVAPLDTEARNPTH